MIKIIDNIDLNILVDEFGFSRNKFSDYRTYEKWICDGRRGQGFKLIINDQNNFICGFAYGADGDGEQAPIDNTLFDLIDARLVEKVSE